VLIFDGGGVVSDRFRRLEVVCGRKIEAIACWSCANLSAALVARHGTWFVHSDCSNRNPPRYLREPNACFKTLATIPPSTCPACNLILECSDQRILYAKNLDGWKVRAVLAVLPTWLPGVTEFLELYPYGISLLRFLR
jgi:hypothetical protein